MKWVDSLVTAPTSLSNGYEQQRQLSKDGEQLLIVGDRTFILLIIWVLCNVSVSLSHFNLISLSSLGCSRDRGLLSGCIQSRK